MRKAREKASSGVYHVIIRGVNKQQIFECEQDYKYFLKVFNKTADDAGMAVYAYCLMGNHVHLLVKEVSEPLGETVKRFTSAYVFYYNHRYERVGHLFQERFLSQPVNDWGYFTTLLRYIHLNPVKANLVSDARDYPWCSWPEYTGRIRNGLCHTRSVLSRISLDELSSLITNPLSADEEKHFHEADNCGRKIRPTDKEIWQLIESACGASDPSAFQALDRRQQIQVIQHLHRNGIGPRPISRITGVPYSLAQINGDKINGDRSFDQKNIK